MTKTAKYDETLRAACEIVLREVGAYPIGPERLSDAMQLLWEIMEEIRRLDEIDLDQIEPATMFKVP